MAPKQAKEIENLTMVSSSEEEEVSGSCGEESVSSGEEDNQEKPNKMSVVVPLATKAIPESSVPSIEEEEEESCDEKSDTSGEEDDQEKPIQTDVSVPVATKLRPESSVSPPESSKAKRSLVKEDDEVKKKKMKKSKMDKQLKLMETEEEVKKISGNDDEVKKKMKRSKTKATEEDVTKSSEDDDVSKKKKKKKKKKRSRTEEEDYEVKKKKMKKLRTDKQMKLMETEEEVTKVSEDDGEAQRKMKRSRTEETKEDDKKISGDEKKKQHLFQRKFSEEDELALLQGILDFTSTRGDPFKDMHGFCGYVKKLISFDANRIQIQAKAQKLKMKFVNAVERSLEKGKGGEDKLVFSKDIHQQAFELSRQIWGNDGVLPSKSRKKLPKDPKPETNVVSTPLSSSDREIVSFLKGENATFFGLDESTLLAHWNMVVEGPKKRAMVEEMKRIKAMQMELLLKRIAFVADTANVIFKEDNASSSGN